MRSALCIIHEERILFVCRRINIRITSRARQWAAGRDAASVSHFNTTSLSFVPVFYKEDVRERTAQGGS